MEIQELKLIKSLLDFFFFDFRRFSIDFNAGLKKNSLEMDNIFNSKRILKNGVDTWNVSDIMMISK